MPVLLIWVAIVVRSTPTATCWFGVYRDEEGNVKRETRPPPEQKQAEVWQQVLARLGVKSAGEAMEAIGALLADEPLTMTMSIQRRTGQTGFASNVAENGKRREQDLLLLRDALSLIQGRIQEAMLKLAEERGRKAGTTDSGN